MTEYEKALEIIKTLNEAGYEALIVGGWVRDRLLNIPSDDIDIATEARAHQVKALFPETCTNVEGTNFHVNIVNGIEVATYRYDMDDDFPLFAECYSEDSARRDLTINSVGFNPLTNQYIDHHGGWEDIENKIIRFVGIAQARIEEDPVRMLRACRFAAKTGFRLIPSAFLAIKDNAYLIGSVPKERLQKEILKALKTPKPSIFWELLHRTGILKIIIPELDDCWYHDGGKFHSEYVHEHLLDCGDYITLGPLVRLAGYLHDIGKVEAYDETDFSFINHDKFGTDIVRDILVKLKFKTKDIEKVCALILLHMRCVEADSTPKSCRRTLAKLEKHNVSLTDFLTLKFADRHANKRRDDYAGEEIHQIITNFTECNADNDGGFSLKDLNLNGRDVLVSGVKPGKGVGVILNHYLELVVDYPESNDHSTLIDLLCRVDDWSEYK